MLELKYKQNDTYTIKGLTEDHINCINTLVAHVRLGHGTAGSAAAFDLSELFEEEGFDLDEMELTIVRDVPDEDVNYSIDLT